jgi:hypothetical protein
MSPSDANFTGGFVLGYLSWTNITSAILAYLVISLTVNFFFSPKYPTSIPWVGYGKSPLGTLRNTFAGFTSSKQWMQDGYNLYSKHGKAFVFPSVLGATAQTMIPRSQLSWMIDQPDHVLSTREAHYETLIGDYAFVSKTCLKDPYHEHVIHKNLARNLNAVLPDLDDEVSRDVDELLGTNTSTWTKVEALEGFMMKIIPQITNRMLVGKPLCRNEHYLNNMMGFTMDVIRAFLIFALTPQILRPLVGNVFSLMPKYHYWQTCRSSVPVIKKRLSDIQKKDAGDPEYKGWKEPNDYITWSIRTSLAEGRHDELKPSMIAMRILPLNFASIHTTALTGSSVLLDIFSSPPDVIASLREEALRVYTTHDRQWTKSGLSTMYRMDSAIRESQRVSAFSLSFVQRKVMVKEGVMTPEGVHCAYGTLLAAPWLALTRDEDLYEKPDVYDAFRFSRERERYEGLSAEEKAKEDGLKFRQNGLVTTNDRHLPFGHGRHAW